MGRKAGCDGPPSAPRHLLAPWSQPCQRIQEATARQEREYRGVLRRQMRQARCRITMRSRASCAGVRERCDASAGGQRTRIMTPRRGASAGTPTPPATASDTRAGSQRRKGADSQPMGRRGRERYCGRARLRSLSPLSRVVIATVQGDVTTCAPVAAPSGDTSVAERSFSLLDRVKMVVKPMAQPFLRNCRLDLFT